MKLQTTLTIPKLHDPITYDSKIVSVGSCFAVHMAEKFKRFQFISSVNPFGILFHPLAIEKLFQFLIDEKHFTEEDVFIYDEIWSSYDAHSDLDALSQEEIVSNLNKKLNGFRKDITEATHLILTLGTAWVYRNNESQQVVANCHKVPQKHFAKEIVSVEQIVVNLNKISAILQQINPQITVLFTISPVRHIKDGFVENQRSKAHLIAALHQFLEENPSDKKYYFPSYELMMDELRDYRFYSADMLHPNELSVEYIWNAFIESCVSSESAVLMKKVDEVQKGLAHRPFNPYSEKHQQFLETLAQKLDELLEKYPFMNFR